MALLTHKNLAIGTSSMWAGFSKLPTPTRMVIVTSPAQWLSAGFHYNFSPILKYTQLQKSSPLTSEHFTELVNKYKPTYMATSPTIMTTMMTRAKCDFACFKTVLIGGSTVTTEAVDEVKQIAKVDDVLYVVYARSEISGIVVQQDFLPAPGRCGRPIGGIVLKFKTAQFPVALCYAMTINKAQGQTLGVAGVDLSLVDYETNKDISEPNALGELWFRRPIVFKGYYNNPEVTKEPETEDAWVKSGDIFYRDHSWNLFFVERYKLLLKYRNHHVSPVEIETVIKRHPAVFHVAVTGIPDRECGDLVVACVVPKPGCRPAAQEIKDLVKVTLADFMQLRGGVIFMRELPQTSTSKIHRKKLKELVLTVPRE